MTVTFCYLITRPNNYNAFKAYSIDAGPRYPSPRIGGDFFARRRVKLMRLLRSGGWVAAELGVRFPRCASEIFAYA